MQPQEEMLALFYGEEETSGCGNCKGQLWVHSWIIFRQSGMAYCLCGGHDKLLEKDQLFDEIA